MMMQDAARRSLGERDRDDDIRVIRRLKPPQEVALIERQGTRTLLVADVETTGLDEGAEPIEVALRPITYQVADGAVVGIHPAYVGLQQPSSPVPEVISHLTGLDDDSLREKRFDLEAIERMARAASICIAHSARFDRPVLEKIAPVFADKPWACSIEDADWAQEGIESAKLCFVAAFVGGFWFDGHRALDDVDALIEIARCRMPQSQQPVLGKILASARRGRYRLRVHAAYEHRTALKERGYRWDPGGVSYAKNWFKDVVDQEAIKDEREAVHRATFGQGQIEVAHLDAYTRFSARL